MPSQCLPRLPLARAMKLHGFTTSALAHDIGVHPITVSRIRTGRQTPSPVTAGLIAAALGTTADALGLGKGGAA